MSVTERRWSSVTERIQPIPMGRFSILDDRLRPLLTGASPDRIQEIPVEVPAENGEIIVYTIFVDWRNPDQRHLLISPSLRGSNYTSYFGESLHMQATLTQAPEGSTYSAVIRTRFDSGVKPIPSMNGGAFMDETLILFEPDICLGYWVSDRHGANLAMYREGVMHGKTPEEAALATWSGRHYAKAGYTNVVVETAEPDVVSARFTRPAGL